MLKCEYCNSIRPTKNSLTAHRVVCPDNPDRKIPWSLGKKRENFSGENHPNYGKRFGSSVNGHSAKTKERLSAVAKGRNLGGYVQGSGRGKKGWYKGFFCDSSWELAYVVYCLEHNIDIKRNTEKRQYIWEGEVKNYIPDFIVDGTLTEIKGFKTEQWLAKLDANPDIRVLYEKDLKPILEYITNKYGKDFINLYE